MPASRSAVAVVVLAIALPLAGCGEEEGVSPERIASAARKTFEVRTARLTISGSVKYASQRKVVSYSAEGVVDYTRRAARLRVRPLRPDKGVALASADVRGELMLTRNTAYARSPALARRFRLGRDRWVRVPLIPRVEAEGIDFGPIGESWSAVWLLRHLRATAGSVERVGEERVRGVRTTRYRMTIDRGRSPAKTDLVPTEVWIDHMDFVRRIEQRFSSGGGAAKYVTRKTRRVELHDLGQSVAVARPVRRLVIGSVAARVATAAKEAQRASDYRLYFLGRSYRGLPLRAVVKSRDPIGPPALPGEPPGRTYVSFSFIYASCEPPRDPKTGLADGGCGAPLVIKNGQTCARPPSGGPRPVERLRGLPAYSLRSDYVALYPGRTSIVIFTNDPDAADVAARLRSLDGGVRHGQPLPKAAPGALEGRLICPN